MAPLLSVVMPVYNPGARFSPCVRSVLSQTLRDLELILVDDGSTDGSAAVCDGFAEQDGRVCVLHLPNGGASAARNAGIEAARGEYLAFCDADDLTEPALYETLLRAARENDADLAVCGYTLHTVSARGERTQALDVFPSPRPGEEGRPFLLGRDGIRARVLPYFYGYTPAELPLRRLLCPFADARSYVWLGVFRAALLREHGLRFPDQRVYFNEDNLFNLLVMRQAGRTVFLPDRLYHYTENPASLSQGFRADFYEKKSNKYAFLRDHLPEGADAGEYEQRLRLKICIEAPHAVNYYASRRARPLRARLGDTRAVLASPELSRALAALRPEETPGGFAGFFLRAAKKGRARTVLALSLGYLLLQRLRV